MIGRIVDWIFAVGGLLGLAATGWWTIYAGPNNAQVLQAELQDRAEKALAASDNDWAFVRVNGQHAIISGNSPTYETSRAAIDAIATVGDNPIFGPITKISSETASAPPISPYVWGAKRMQDDTIVLTGHVPSHAILKEIERKASGLTAGAVQNELRVGSGEPLGPWRDVALTGLSQLALMDTGEVRLVDSRLFVNGTATQNGARAQILKAVENLESPYRSEADVQGANLWSARHEDGVLILSGVVPTAVEKTRLVSVAQASYGGEVRDEMEIGPGQFDDWQRTVAAALPHFASFDSGLMGFSPRGGGFVIRGEAAQSTVAFLQEDTADSAYEVNMDVAEIEPELIELVGLPLTDGEPGACQAGFDAIMAGNTLAFESAEATITRDSGPTLDKIMKMARLCPQVQIEVRGHTDSGGERDYNVSLSKWRATAVVDYMKMHGVAPERLKAVGFGPDEPIADNGTQAGRAANRRIEFKINEEGS